MSVMDEITTRYKNSGEIDEETYLQISLYNQCPPKERRKLVIWCVVMIVMSLLLLYMGSEYAVFFLTVFVLLLGLFIYLPALMRKNGRNAFREAAPGGKLAYTSSFTDDKLMLVNHTNGGSGELPLMNVKKVFEANGVWALFSKGGMFYPVFAKEMSETDRESLLALLKQNNPKIKIQLPKEEK